MKKNKKLYFPKTIAIILSIIMMIPILGKYKKEIKSKIENLYLNYFVNNVDCLGKGKIIEENNNLVVNIPKNNSNNEEKQIEIEIQPKPTPIATPKPTPEIEEITKQVALTFDDGPSKYTLELLEILKFNNAKASFFVLGSRINKYGDVIEKIKNDNHQIECHGTNHEDFTKLSNEELKQMLDETKTLLSKYEVTQTLIRPPYGSLNKRVKENIKYPLIMWSLDTKDWQHRNSKEGTRIIIENIEEGSIILMHDLYKTTINTIKEVLPILKEQGYQFVTIDELFDEVELIDGKVYYKKTK